MLAVQAMVLIMAIMMLCVVAVAAVVVLVDAAAVGNADSDTLYGSFAGAAAAALEKW